MERDVPTQKENVPEPVAGRIGGRKRAGSRVLLAASLAAGVVGAIIAGATIADFLSDSMGISGTAARLGLKVAWIAAFLPAGFYLVERYFLSRSSRDR